MVQINKCKSTYFSDTEKRVESGWGADEGDKELKAEDEGEKDAAAETPANDWGVESTPVGDSWGVPVETSGDVAQESAPAETRRKEEEEDNTLTLDQYLAQQKEKEGSLVPKLEGGRKVEENWKDVVPLQKVEEETYFVGKTKAAPKAKAKKEEKIYLEIDAKFERPNRGGPRGGRGGGDRRGGGRGGRGGPRGGGAGRQASGAAAVNVDDETAFPSLS